MRKLILITLTILFSVSCDKKDKGSQMNECECGTVVDLYTNSVQTPFIEIENNCSGNIYKDTYFEENKEVGDRACLGFEW